MYIGVNKVRWILVLLLISMNSWAENIGPVSGGGCIDQKNCELWIENTSPAGKGGVLHNKVKSGLLGNFGLTSKAQSLADKFCSHYDLGKAELLDPTDEFGELNDQSKWEMQQARLFNCAKYIYADQPDYRKYYALHVRGDFSLEKLNQIAKKNCGSLEPKFINNFYGELSANTEVSLSFNCYDPNIPTPQVEKFDSAAIPKIHEPLPYSGTGYDYRNPSKFVGYTSPSAPGGYDPKNQSNTFISNPIRIPSNTNDLNIAKKQCADLGFKAGTEKFGKCILELTK